MKLTNNLLSKLIKEVLDHGGLGCGEVHPQHTHHEWEGHKKDEEKKTKAMAKISIKVKKKLPKKLNETKPCPPGTKEYKGKCLPASPTDMGREWGETPISEDDSPREDYVPKSELRDVLKTWMEKEYDSDEDRWREYGKDIQELVGDELKEG